MPLDVLVDRLRAHRSIFVFAIMGGMTTVVHIVTGLALHHVAGMTAAKANIVAYITAFFVSYSLHRNVTFRSTASVGQSLPKFLAISVLGFVLCQLIVVMMVNVMGFSYAAALAVMVTTVPVVTYVLSRIWAFRDGHF